jgi:hypothetical protein
MSKDKYYEVELQWFAMTPVEQSLWGTTVALHTQDADGGIGAADEAITKIRSLAGVRSHRLAPEYEAAKANITMEYEAFAVWYPIEHKIRLCREPRYRAPTVDEVRAAYVRFCESRSDYF